MKIEKVHKAALRVEYKWLHDKLLGASRYVKPDPALLGKAQRPVGWSFQVYSGIEPRVH